MVAKASLRIWHRRLGLCAALFLAVQGLSGVVIVWRDELLYLSTPRVTQPVSGLDTDAMLAIASLRHPDMTPKRLDLPTEPDVPIMLRLVGTGDDRLLFFSPGSGTLLSDATARTYPGEFAYQLHTRFLTGPAGRWIIVFDGIALLLIAMTGVWFWWPGRRNLRRALRLTARGPAHHFVAEAHRVAGASLSLALGLIAVTGLLLALMPETVRLLGADAAPIAAKAKPTAPFLPIASLLATARRAVPAGHMRSLRFSGPGARTLRIVFTATAPHAWSIDEVWIDRVDGRVAALSTAGRAGSAKAALSWILPLHTWRWAGPLGQILGSVFGLALIAFAASGTWLWARRKWCRPNRTAST